MPAVSKAQRRAAAKELERRKAGQEPEKFAKMSEDELEKLASTPERGLPKRAPKPAKGGAGHLGRFGREI